MIPTPTAAAVDLPARFRQLVDATAVECIDKMDELDAIANALVSRSHVFLLGKPGAGKSFTLDRLLARISHARKFKILVRKDTTINEVFGPVSLKGLTEDRFEFKTAGFLPEAHIAHVEEMYKANSALLNGLLGVVLEREFTNDGVIVKCPLSTLVSASNELPQGEDLAAFFDRIHFRMVSKGLPDADSFVSMLRLRPDPNPQPILAWTQVEAAQRQAAALPVADDVYEALVEMRQELRRLGIEPSERRFRQTLPIIQARAWLSGATEADVVHMEDLVHVFWEAPEQARKVEKLVLDVCSPAIGEAVAIADEVGGIADEFLEAMKLDPDQRYAPLMQVQGRLKRAKKTLDQLKTRSAGRALRVAEKADRELEALAERVMVEGFNA